MNLIEQQLNTVEQALLMIAVFRPGDAQPCTHASGFVVEISEQWCLITAAHAIDEFDVMRQKVGDCKFTLISPTPYASANNAPKGPRHADFDYPGAVRCAMPRTLKDQGGAEVPPELFDLDIGFIVLSDYVRAHLLKIGVKPLEWRNVYEEAPEQTAKAMEAQEWMGLMVGFPRLAFKPGTDQSGAKFSTLRLRVSGTNEVAPPRMVFRPAWRREEYGGDVKGMSGCAIVLLGLNYPRVVAVQSAQFAVEDKYPKKLIAIESSFFFELLAGIIRVAENHSNESEGAGPPVVSVESQL